MRNILTAILVGLIMILAILGISNPGRENYRMFDNIEGKLTHNYFFFSIYQQYGDSNPTDSSNYRVYRRFIGIGMRFYEISPVKIKQE